MAGLSADECGVVRDVLLNAERVLLHDGSSLLSIAVVANPLRTECCTIELIDAAERGDGAVRIVAAAADFVTRVADGQLLIIRRVEKRAHVIIYHATQPRLHELPCPLPEGWTAPIDVVNEDGLTRSMYSTFELRADEIDLARKYSTFATVKQLVVMPLTRGTGRSLAQLLGPARDGYESAARGATDGEDPLVTRRATHFFVFNFAQRFDDFVEGFRALVAKTAAPSADVARRLPRSRCTCVR